MGEKRRDSKNRILRNGESQRKDGRYVYVYRDGSGEQKFLYSWKLEKTDRLPLGKRECVSLREQINKLQEDIVYGIESGGNKITVLRLVEKYVAQKKGVKHNTQANYNLVINIIKKETFGGKRIDKVKLSDAKAWLSKLQSDGKGYSTVRSVRSVVRPAFQMAVDDDLIRKNPFAFNLATVVVNNGGKREGLSEEQEEKFLHFVKHDKHYSKYYEALYILFNTGVRISEFCGLVKEDIDFTNECLRIERQLHRKRDGEYVIEEPKSASGVRYIPMDKDVAECFKRLLQKRKQLKVEPIIEGVHGFLYFDKKNMPLIAMHWEKYVKNMKQKYNKVNNSELLDITPHVCRHTFCSRKAKEGMNPKVLQYIMGHSNIGITLNTYTHVNFEDAQKEMKRVNNA